MHCPTPTSSWGCPRRGAEARVARAAGGRSRLILALANPEPEILPAQVAAVRPDAIVATGRSDYPNQVNNVLCFPFIFRGALDVSATTINEPMKIAAAEAIAGLARMEASEVVAAAYGGSAPVFGADYIIPKPFDPRLILEIAPAVARAAMESGVARRPIRDLARLPERTRALRIPLRPAHASGLRGRQAGAAAHRLRRRRGRAGAAGGADAGRRWDRATDPARPPRGDRAQRFAIWACASIRPNGVRVLDPARDDEVFGPLLRDYQGLVGTPRHPAGGCRLRPDPARHRRGGDAAACRPRRCRDLRRQRQLVAPGALRAADHSAPAGRQPRLRARLPDPAARHAVHLRHPDGGRSDRGAGRRNDRARRRSGQRIRHHAKGGTAVALQFRRQRFGVPPARCEARWRCCANVPRSWKWMAR